SAQGRRRAVDDGGSGDAECRGRRADLRAWKWPRASRGPHHLRGYARPRGVEAPAQARPLNQLIRRGGRPTAAPTDGCGPARWTDRAKRNSPRSRKLRARFADRDAPPDPREAPSIRLKQAARWLTYTPFGGSLRRFTFQGAASLFRADGLPFRDRCGSPSLAGPRAARLRLGRTRSPAAHCARLDADEARPRPLLEGVRQPDRARPGPPERGGARVAGRAARRLAPLPRVRPLVVRARADGGAHLER